MQEIEARAAFSQQQLQIVKSQMAAKQRDIRLLQLTSKELDTLPKSTKVYEGVGKMYGGSLILPPSSMLSGCAVVRLPGSMVLSCSVTVFFFFSPAHAQYKFIPFSHLKIPSILASFFGVLT